MEFILSSSILIIFLLCGSFSFSGSETAMFSLNRVQIHYLETQGSSEARIIANFLAHPSNLLVTILFGNQVINILASSIAAALCDYIFGVEFGPIIATIGMTFALLICGEVTPKIFAVQNPQKFAFFMCRPLVVFSKLVFPVRIVLTAIADAILRFFGGARQSSEHLVTEQEFRTLLDVSEREGVVETSERRIIDKLFEFSEVTVKEIMIPRADMYCFSIDNTFDEIIEQCKTELYARVPVYNDTIDTICGIVYTKDLLPFIHKTQNEFHLRNFLRDVYFIPETKKVQELLKDFQEKKIHIAIVVDEYGGTAGLVCLEDVLEEIVGDITDEFDTDEMVPVLSQEEGPQYKINAMMHIHEFNQRFGTDFSSEYYGTVAGLVLDLLGKVPKKGDTVKVGELTFTVNKLRKFRILELIVKRSSNN